MVRITNAATRAAWIREKLRDGKRWNATDLAAEFGVTARTARRNILDFRAAYPEWIIAYDGREKTYYLDNELPLDDGERQPAGIQMTAGDFAVIRERLDLTQDQLADCIGTGQGRISEWELGAAMVPADVAWLMRAWERARLYGLWWGRRRRRPHKNRRARNRIMPKKLKSLRLTDAEAKAEREREYNRAYAHYRRKGDTGPLGEFYKKYSE